MKKWIAIFALICTTSFFGFTLPKSGISISDHLMKGPALSVVSFDNSRILAGFGPFLDLIDVSNPSSPTVVSEIGLQGSIYGLTVTGNKVLVADGGGGIIFLDYTNPLNPSIDTSYNTLGVAYQILPYNNLYYVADGKNGIGIFKQKSDGKLKTISYIQTSGIAYSLAIIDDYLVSASGSSGLEVFHIGKPRHPKKKDGLNSLNEARSIVVVGTHGLVANGSEGLSVVKFGNPEAPRLINTLSTGGIAEYVTVSGNLAYVADGDGGLTIVDITNIESPTIKSNLSLSGYSSHLSAYGTLAFVSEGLGGLSIVSISNPDNPQILSNVEGRAQFGPMVVKGSTAIIANDGEGLLLFNVSNPANPVYADSFPLANQVESMTLYGDILTISFGGPGIAFYNIANPYSPILLSEVPGLGQAMFVLVDGNKAYVADSEWEEIKDFSNDCTPPKKQPNGKFTVSKIHILSISDIYHPVETGSFQVIGLANNIFVSGNRAYVLSGKNGLRIMNIENLSSVCEVSAYVSDSSSIARSLSVSGNTITIVYGSNIEVVDITDETKPQKSYSYSSLGQAMAYRQDGNLLYIASSTDGLEVLNILDISDPSNYEEVAYFDTPGFTRDMEIIGNSVLLSDGEAGLWSVSYSPCNNTSDMLLTPCDGEIVSSQEPPLFTYKANGADRFEIEISADPSFPKGKDTIRSGKKEHPWHKYLSWTPLINKYNKMKKLGTSLYWHVLYKTPDNTEGMSETRSFSID